MMDYRWVGDHPQDLASGRMLEPGEVCTLEGEDLDSHHNQALIEGGGLIPVDVGEGQKKQGKKPEGGDGA